jgi:TldD protein
VNSPGKSVFLESYGVSVQDVESYLSAALERGGDYADLFFELRINHSITLEEQLIKTATKAVNLGVGIRVLSGEKTGYAYSENLDRENILKAARTAAFIASSSTSGGKIGLSAPAEHQHNLYSVTVTPAELEIHEKIALLKEADASARSYDSRIHQVQASFIDETRHTSSCIVRWALYLGCSAHGPVQRHVHR